MSERGITLDLVQEAATPSIILRTHLELHRFVSSSSFIDHFVNVVAKEMAERVVKDCFDTMFEKIKSEVDKVIVDKLASELFPKVMEKINLNATAKLATIQIAKQTAKEATT